MLNRRKRRTAKGVIVLGFLGALCGIPRDIAEFCEGLDDNLKSRIQYSGMDLDPELLKIAKEWRFRTSNRPDRSDL